MERHKCKLCFKIFINGKALGGHMRSHLVTLPVSEDRRPNRPKDPKPSEETSSSSSDPEFPVAGSVVLQDRESETESSKNPTRRRSKRIRKFKSPNFRSNFEPRSGEFKKFNFSKVSESWTEQEPVSSSISDVTTEEDVAFCLMMMSRDKWRNKQRKKPEMSKSADDEETEEDEEEEDEEEEEEEETDETEGKYTCETCTKTFRSYQALGGHRASHRKNQTAPLPEEEAVTVARAPPPPETATSAAMRGESKVHECPYCFRVFGSGQALGGHKRSHAAIYGSVSAAVPVSKKVRNTVIDLNLPAPVEEGEYGEVEL